MKQRRRMYAIAVAVSIAVSVANAQENAALRALADRYWDAVMERSPQRATSLGDHRFNDRLDDLSAQAMEKWRATLNDLVVKARRLRSVELSVADKLTRDLLERDINDAIIRLDCLDHLMPYDPLDGPHLQFPLLLVSQPFNNAKDFENYIARLRGFEKQVTDVIENGRKGILAGLIPPRVIVQRIIPQIREHAVRDVDDSELLSPRKELSVVSKDRQRGIEDQMVKAVRDAVIPGYLRLLAFMEDEVLPRSRPTVGLGELPDGEHVYEAKVYLNTTVRISADEVHEIGKREVERIRAQMDVIREEMNFEKDLDAFLAHMRTDPHYRFKSAEELLAAADEILQRAKPKMKELFGRLPKADCVIKPIEPFRAASAPVAYYNPSPKDGTRPGYYYVNTHAPQERLRFTLEALSYHEAVPGHHLQMALDQENVDLPTFRRYTGYTGYVEGWALYTEKLGYQIGGYQTPQDRFGQLTFEMWRACRLVVDTGMHAKGWSRQQAIDYMAKNTSLALLDIEAEVDRYITWPGQALGYKIGELRILEMRRKAEAALGARFDLPAFHDALLAGGAMPIDLLEKRMGAWVKSQAGS